MKVIKWALVAALIAATSLGVYSYWYANTAVDFMLTDKKIDFELARGAHPLEVSKALEKTGVIQNHKLFYLLGKITRGWGNIKAAEYELTPAMTPLQIFKVLQSGIGIHRELLVREGENIYQIADTFTAAGLGSKEQILMLMKNHDLIAILGLQHEGSSVGLPSLEGYLFPNTYFYEKKDLAITVLKRMVDAFLKSWTAEYTTRAQELGMSRFQVVTLASMIEKETGAAVERPIISSVFHNRLKKRMRLQSDPTTIYGIWDHYDGVIHKSDLLDYNSYNTYTIPALPIGPIANPSADAIKAALYPAQSDYLYFVSRNNGTHLFTKNYEDHRHGVKKFQK